MRYIYFNNIKDAIRYRRAISDAICRFAVNECGYERKKVQGFHEPKGKRLRKLVNDPYFKRTGKRRKNKGSWRWNPPIYLACIPYLNGRELWAFEDFRHLLLVLILENCPSIQMRRVKKYFGRFLALPVKDVSLLQMKDRRVERLDDLKWFRRKVYLNTGYRVGLGALCYLLSESPFYPVTETYNWIETNPSRWNRVIDALEDYYDS